MIQEVTKLSQLDYWRVFRAGKQKRADVFEFKGKYESGMKHQLLRFAMATSVATDLAVRATLIVVSGKKFPKQYREIEPIDCVGLRMEFGTLRPWEIEASVALEFERPTLLSLVPFMKHTWAQLTEALRQNSKGGARGAGDVLACALVAIL